jgi:hypothetical protein
LKDLTKVEMPLKIAQEGRLERLTEVELWGCRRRDRERGMSRFRAKTGRAERNKDRR